MRKITLFLTVAIVMIAALLNPTQSEAAGMLPPRTERIACFRPSFDMNVPLEYYILFLVSSEKSGDFEYRVFYDRYNPDQGYVSWYHVEGDTFHAMKLDQPPQEALWASNGFYDYEVESVATGEIVEEGLLEARFNCSDVMDLYLSQPLSPEVYTEISQLQIEMYTGDDWNVSGHGPEYWGGVYEPEIYPEDEVIYDPESEIIFEDNFEMGVFEPEMDMEIDSAQLVENSETVEKLSAIEEVLNKIYELLASIF